MTKEAALKVKIGDKLIYKEYTVIKVADIKYTTPNNVKYGGVIFYDKLGNTYTHRYCRRYEENDKA